MESPSSAAVRSRVDVAPASAGVSWGAIAAHVRSFGGEPESPRELYGADGFGPSIYVRDLDGNRVELKGPPTRQLQDPRP